MGKIQKEVYCQVEIKNITGRQLLDVYVRIVETRFGIYIPNFEFITPEDLFLVSSIHHEYACTIEYFLNDQCVCTKCS